MRYWALQYGPSVEVLEPESLRNRIISDIKDMEKGIVTDVDVISGGYL